MAQNFRVLRRCLVQFLDGAGEPTWPPYRKLKTYSIRRKWAFAEREYRRLRQVHIGTTQLVTSLISFLTEYEHDFLRQSIDSLNQISPDCWLDELSEFADGRQLRNRDYLRGVTWKELPLAHFLGSDGNEPGFCRDVETARRIAFAQYYESAKTILPLRRWRETGVNSPELIHLFGDRPDEFMDLTSRFWEVHPECVWLTHYRGQLIGGSIVLPLTESAYRAIHSGIWNEDHLTPVSDFMFPSRYQFAMAFTHFPELCKLRIPGVLTAVKMRRILEHFAVLLGDNESTEPLHLLAATAIHSDGKALERLGWKSLGRNLEGSDCPLYEFVLPPPETTVADYSTAAATFASLIGIAWRMLKQG